MPEIIDVVAARFYLTQDDLDERIESGQLLLDNRTNRAISYSVKGPAR